MPCISLGGRSPTGGAGDGEGDEGGVGGADRIVRFCSMCIPPCVGLHLGRVASLAGYAEGGEGVKDGDFLNLKKQDICWNLSIYFH